MNHKTQATPSTDAECYMGIADTFLAGSHAWKQDAPPPTSRSPNALT